MIYTAYGFLSISLFMIENRGRSPREAIIRQQGNQPDQSPHGGGSKSPERQLLPSVWTYLERHVRLHAPDVEVRPQRGSEAYQSEVKELNRLSRGMDKRGSHRTKLIRDLYGEIRCEPASFPNPARLRDLSLEEFQQFRSQVEPMTEEQIAEELRKVEEENDRKSDEFLKKRGGGFSPKNSIARV
jgi:hypothetical protein